MPGRYGFDYLYPSAPTIGRFAGLGMTTMRLPVRWERLQPALRQPLDPEELVWLNCYHAHVMAKIGPTLSGADLDWLQKACAPILTE